MFSDAEIEEINKEIAKFPHKRYAVLDVLMALQKRRNYIADDVIVHVAKYLELSPTEVDGIASFYNLIFRKPVGKAVIRLCDSVSCWIMGYEAIKRDIKKVLNIDFGMTTADGKATLLPAQCLGACDKAPALMINDQLYTNVNKAQLREILSAHGMKDLSDEAAVDEDDEGRRKTGQSKRVSVFRGV